MISSIAGLSVLAYIIAFLRFRKKLIPQQISYLFVFIIGLTFIGELDVLLPIYFVFVCLTFIPRLRYVSKFTLFVCLYFGVYLLIGVIAQDLTRTLVTFIAKMWQLIIFFVVLDNDIDVGKVDCKKIIWISVIIETAIGVYLLLTSTNIDANGLARLVSNAQPITGNIATATLPISVYYYIRNRSNPKVTTSVIAANLIFLVWIILSGTRGYTMEYAAAMVLIFYDYFTTRKIGKVSWQKRLFVLFALIIGSILLILVVPEILEKMSSVLRLKSSVGIRTYENAAELEFFANAPWYVQIFGIGLGGTGGSYNAFNEALAKQFSLGMWDRRHYMYDSGAIFHNFYANVLMCLGLVGVVFVVIIYIEMWKKITEYCDRQALERRILHLFLVSFMLMNYYRWSAVCGIGEMVIFALVLKKVKQDTNEEFSIKSGKTMNDSELRGSYEKSM